MKQEKKQEIALMRYSALAPLITGTQDDFGSLSAFFRAACAKGIKAPDGSMKHYSPKTLEKWYLAYRKCGFDALIPTGRSDCGVSRKIDEDLREQISYLKHTYPRMSAAAIYKQLQDNGSIRSGQISESTVCRFINQLVLQERLTVNQDMRRYERPHINEVWYGDSSSGPYLKTPDGKKHRVYIIALIDDASRFVIESSFLLEAERRVSADCVIVMDQIEYEVDYRFAKQRITLRYSPDMEKIFVVEADDSLTPIRLLNKQENSMVKRDKVRLTGGDA